MFITPTSSRQPAKVKNSKRNSIAGTGFRSLIGSGYARMEMSEAANGVSNIEGIIALQGLDENTSVQERIIAKGHKLLNELEELKIAVLGGQIPTNELESISNSLAMNVNGDIPKELKTIMDEIELRAKVELAKRGIF